MLSITPSRHLNLRHNAFAKRRKNKINAISAKKHSETLSPREITRFWQVNRPNLELAEAGS